METTAKPKFSSWLRRQSPWLIALGIFILYIYVQGGLFNLLSWLYDAPAVTPNGPDLEGSQVEAARQSMGVPLGLIVTKLLTAIGFFLAGISLVWMIMHRITPVLPAWAKVDFTTCFQSLSSAWQFTVYLASWLGLLFFFALCVLAASLVQ